MRVRSGYGGEGGVGQQGHEGVALKISQVPSRDSRLALPPIPPQSHGRPPPSLATPYLYIMRSW